jgi:hypothetical protein
MKFKNFTVINGELLGLVGEQYEAILFSAEYVPVELVKAYDGHIKEVVKVDGDPSFIKGIPEYVNNFKTALHNMLVDVGDMVYVRTDNGKWISVFVRIE